MTQPARVTETTTPSALLSVAQDTHALRNRHYNAKLTLTCLRIIYLAMPASYQEIADLALAYSSVCKGCEVESRTELAFVILEAVDDIISDAETDLSRLDISGVEANCAVAEQFLAEQEKIIETLRQAVGEFVRSGGFAAQALNGLLEATSELSLEHGRVTVGDLVMATGEMSLGNGAGSSQSAE